MSKTTISAHFQSMFHASNNTGHSKQVLHVEALARLDIGSTISLPQKFIPEFEQNGLMPKLFHGMSVQACCLITAAETQHDSNICVSLNLDSQTLQMPKTASRLKDTLDQHGVAINRIKLELLEQDFENSSSVAERKVIFNALSELQEIGFPLSMDDFGTEASKSIRYFNLQDKGIEVKTIKLDRSLMPSQNISTKQLNRNLSISGFHDVLEHSHERDRPLSFVLEGANKKDIAFYKSIISPKHDIYAQGFDWAKPKSFSQTLDTCSLHSKRTIDFA